MRRLLFRLLCAENAGAILELAVGFPIMLLLAIGVADYARVYYTSIAVASAAQAGVHYGVAFDGNPDSMTLSTQRDAGTLTLDSISVGQYCSCPETGVVACDPTPCAGLYGLSQVFDTVRVREDVALIIRYPGLPSTIAVTKTAVLRQR